MMNILKKINYYDNFEFLIGIQNSSMIVHRDDTIYYAKGFIFKTIKNETSSINQLTEIDLEPCDMALKESKTYDFVQNINLYKNHI